MLPDQKKIINKIAIRLNEEISKAGYKSNNAFADAMSALGFPISGSAINEIRNGTTSPKTINWIGISKVLGKSLDFLILGKETREIDPGRIYKIIEDSYKNKSEDDPQITELQRLFKELPDELKSALLQFARAARKDTEQK